MRASGSAPAGEVSSQVGRTNAINALRILANP